MKKKITDKIFCSECNCELKRTIIYDMNIDPDDNNSNKFFVEPCDNCNSINSKIKEDYHIISNALLSKMKIDDNDIIKQFTTMDENYNMILKFLTYEIDVKLDKPGTFQDNLDVLKKRLGLLDIINPIIDKILPEYREVPLEYKILLLKERIDATIKQSANYKFDEITINELAELLANNQKITMIKSIRNYLSLGLKEAKDLVESKFSSAEFDMRYSFDTAKKMIMERF